MAKGVLYIMTTIVDGLIKIGKTKSDQFDNRMYTLEHNGYCNVTGLKRSFAIEVEDYDEKEELLHKIFDKSRVPNTELFALDLNLAILLMSSLEGTQIYPQTSVQTKSQVFANAAESVNKAAIPDGVYYLKRKMKNYNNKEVNASMKIEGGKYIVLAGSDFCPIDSNTLPQSLIVKRKKAKVKDGKLLKDEECSSASYAAMFVLGNSESGMRRWKDKSGKSLNDILYSGSN